MTFVIVKALRAVKDGQLEKQGTGNGTGMGNGNGKREWEAKICAKLLGQRHERKLVALGYCLHESQGRVGLRTHGSLTLFMSRTRKNCGGGGGGGGGGYNNQLDHRQPD